MAYWCWVRLLAPHYRSDDGGEPVDEVRLLVRAAERETIPMMRLRVTRAVSEKTKLQLLQKHTYVISSGMCGWTRIDDEDNRG